MLPALRENSANFLFFGVFLFVGIYLLAILLAIVVDSYWLFAKKHVKKERARERAELAKAWNLLDPLGLGSLSVHDEQFFNLFRILKPKNSDEQNQMLIELLDSNFDGEIDSFEWTTLLRQSLQAEFEEDSDDEEDTKCNSTNFKARLKRIPSMLLHSTTFSKMILCLIFLHCVLFAVRWRGQSSQFEFTVHVIRTVIVAIFTFEAILKIPTFGKTMLQALEMIDQFLVFVALLFNALWYFKLPSLANRDFSVTISSLVIFLRLFLNSAETRKAFYWFLSIAPVMIDLMILLFVIMYFLASIGMELFHTYPLSETSQIYPDECGLGFKTFFCSFLVQFQLLTTSNWHEIMNMVEKETKSKTSYLYFAVSYIVITMIIMNLFTAIAIEAANKLALSKEEKKENMKNQESEKKAKKPKELAKKAVNEIAKKLFSSTRVQGIHHKEKRLSMVLSNMTITGGNTIILQSPRKSSSTPRTPTPETEGGNIEAQMEEFFSSESSEGEEDYTGLDPKTKREKQLKRRMRRKRRERRQRELREELEAEERDRAASPWKHVKEFVRVVTAFKGQRHTDLSINVGETVLVLEKGDEWFRGESQGKVGWFPASHVVTCIIEDPVDIVKVETAELTNEAFVEEQPDVLEKLTPEEVVYVQESSLRVEKVEPIAQQKKLPPINSTLQPLSQPKHKLKMKRADDWTRNILGDITVMNADEMRELNKVMRAEMKAPSLMGRGRSRQGMGFYGSSTNLNQRDHGVLIEEQTDNDVFHDTARPRSETQDSLLRPGNGVPDTISKPHQGTPDNTSLSGSTGSVSRPLIGYSGKVRPLSASHVSRPVTPTAERVSGSRPRASTLSSPLAKETSQLIENDRPILKSTTGKLRKPSKGQVDEKKQVVVSVDTGTPSPPETIIDDFEETDNNTNEQQHPSENEKGHLKVDTPPMSDAKTGAKKKVKSENGDMPGWMKSFVISNNLVVADDLKLDSE